MCMRRINRENRAHGTPRKTLSLTSDLPLLSNTEVGLHLMVYKYSPGHRRLTQDLHILLSIPVCVLVYLTLLLYQFAM